jgi:hypothetical protein
MSLNFVLPQNSRWMLGDLDITEIVVDFSVRHPIAEITTPLIWKGTLNVAQKEGEPFKESLSELENPSRWERCQQPLEVYFGNIKFLTLEIDSYFYDEDTGRGTAEVTDKLGLLDWRSPADEIEGVKVGKDNDWWEVVKLALIQAGKNPESGAEYLTKADIAFESSYTPEGSYAVPLVKVNGSYIKFAQAVAGAHGHWLWCDRDGKIRLAKYPLNPTSAIASLSRSRVAKYEREGSPERPYERIIVTGTKDEVADCGDRDGGETIETWGYIGESNVVIRRETISPVDRKIDKDVVTRVVQRALGDIMPDNKKYQGSTRLITESNETETWYYDRENRLYKRTITRKKALCSMFPSNFPDDFSLKGSEQEIEEFIFKSRGIRAAFDFSLLNGKKSSENDAGSKCREKKLKIENDDNVIKQKILTKYSQFLFAQGTSTQGVRQITPLMIREEINETWSKKTPGGGTRAAGASRKKLAECDRWKYRRTVKRRDTIRKESSFNVSEKPEWEYGVVPNEDPEGSTFTIGEVPVEEKPKEPIVTVKPGDLALIEITTQEDSRPPAPTYREAETPTGTVTFCGEDVFELPYDSCAEKTQEQNVDWLTTQENAQLMAQLIGKIQWHRRYARSVSHPIYYPWFLEEWEPFVSVNIKDGHYICDGLVVSCVRSSVNEAEFAWTGNYVGKNDREIKDPVFRQIQYPAAKCGNFQIIRNNPGGYSLTYAGSIPPFPLPGEAIVTGLPAGMNFSNGVISGHPATPGIYSGSIQLKNIFYPIDIFSTPAVNPRTTYQSIGTSYTLSGTNNNNLNQIPAGSTVTGLPEGITYNPSTGRFEGSPITTGTHTITASINGQDYDFALVATENTGTYQPTSYLVGAPQNVFFDPVTGTISGDAGSSTSFVVATQNSNGTITYSTVEAVNDGAAFTASAVVSGLPPNVMFDPITQTLSGQVSPGTTYTFTVQQPTPTGITSATYSIAAASPPPPPPPTIQDFIVDEGYYITLYLQGIQSATGLPSGIALNQEFLQGRPLSSGTFPVTATILSQGVQHIVNFDIIVTAKPVVDPYIKLPLVYEIQAEVIVLASESSLIFADLMVQQLPKVVIQAEVETVQVTALDFGLIVVDMYGRVLTEEGSVVTQSVTDEFDVIVIDRYGQIVTENGFVVTTTGDSRFNAILVNKHGEVVTENGKVVTSP